MFINSSNSNYRITLPLSLIDDDVSEYYNQYLDSEDFAYNTIHDLIEANLQAINIPGFNANTVGNIRFKKSGAHGQETMTKNLTLTFRHLSGYITLFPLLESAEMYFKTSGKENLHIGNIDLQMMDSNGDVLYYITFIDCLYDSLPYPEVSFTETGERSDTIDLSLIYN